ncbi:MAG: paraquat-inducible protein A [Magnetococcales bacterium]|nr:paraquat-inducible protein A [Magnetococcales bacterium]
MSLSPVLLACPHCDALHRSTPLPPGESALCHRCGTPLYHNRRAGVAQPLAFALTGLLLFILANSYPLLTLELGGRTQSSTLWTGITALFEAGLWLLAPLVFCTSLLFPLLTLVAMLYLLLPLQLHRRPGRHAPLLQRLLATLTPWSMTGIYLLGILIAIVKLRDMAEITPGIASYAFFGLLLSSILAQRSLEQGSQAWEALHPTSPEHTNPLWQHLQRSDAPHLIRTARQAGWSLCHTCAALLLTQGTCPRCGDRVHLRKPASLSHTWALLLAAALLYIPANLLPIMTVIRFGQGEPDTILSGVQHLMASGLWPLALIILFASVLVPLMKLAVLTFLLLSVHYQTKWRLRERTTLYRVIELFGHWSMVDIFLLAVLTALVQLGSLTTIEPGNGATFFGMVVVLTMLATRRFDPRLMWDVLEKPEK